MSWSYFLFALPALALTKLPLIYRAGDALPEHSAFHRWIVRQMRRRVTRVVCNSEFVARRFNRLGFAPVVIHNHPPLRLEEKAVALPAKISGAVQLIYIGQIAKHKGIALLVETVIGLIRDGLNVTLLVAGDSVWGDPLRKELEETVHHASATDRIHFLGAVENVPSVLRASDVHVCPSIWDDPSPNVIVEAKREGIPTVAFPVGGIPELIEHEVDGYLCHEVSAEGLGAGVRYFLEASRRRAAGQAAHQKYETNFGFSSFQRQWIEIVSRAGPPC
ncbi:MAG TPA: glycosyltransferase family 4 protein, partial [Chthoniobacterales bacterium]